MTFISLCDSCRKFLSRTFVRIDNFNVFVPSNRKLKRKEKKRKEKEKVKDKLYHAFRLSFRQTI